MLNLIEGENVNNLHEIMCNKLMFGDNSEETDYDWVHGTEVGLHNVILGAESFNWQFDLKRLWLPYSRWTMMVRQYLHPDRVDRWLEQIDDRLHGRGRGIAVLRTNTVQGRGTGKGVRRRWGSCMLSISFRSNPVPTIALHSRTTYFGYLAAMDITVAHVLARRAGSILGIKPEDMNFVWTLDLAQFHGFRSLAWPLSDPEMKSYMDDDVSSRLDYPIRTGQAGYRKALDGYARLVKSDQDGKLYGDEAFSSFARVRRRFHAEVMPAGYADQFIGGSLNRGGHNPFSPLPSVHSDDLDLSPLYNPKWNVPAEQDMDGLDEDNG